MSDITKYSDGIWDRFFDFSFGGTEPLTRADVQAKLKGLGINLTKAMGRVQQALDAARAREELAAARAKRPGLIAAMANSAIAQAGTMLREKLQQLIERTFQGHVQAAYYRKLEAAASDDDLRSLLEDMQRLEDMEKRKDDAK